MNDRNRTILMFLLGITATLGVVLLAVVLTRDDGSSDTTGAASTSGAVTTTVVPTTTTEPSATTSTEATTTTGAAATTTTAAAATTTAAPSGPCTGLPSASTPSPGPGVTFASGDFDGNGTADKLVAYQASDGSGRVQIALSYGYATEMAVFGPAEALGAQAFVGDPKWVGIAAVDAGASTQVFGFVQLNGCSIGYSTIDGVGEATFVRGGGVTHMDGMVCAMAGVTALSASTSDGTNWEAYTYGYDWDPTTRGFLFAGAAASTLVYPADEAAIFSHADFSCPYVP